MHTHRVSSSQSPVLSRSAFSHQQEPAVFVSRLFFYFFGFRSRFWFSIDNTQRQQKTKFEARKKNVSQSLRDSLRTQQLSSSRETGGKRADREWKMRSREKRRSWICWIEKPPKWYPIRTTDDVCVCKETRKKPFKKEQNYWQEKISKLLNQFEWKISKHFIPSKQRVASEKEHKDITKKEKNFFSWTFPKCSSNKSRQWFIWIVGSPMRVKLSFFWGGFKNLKKDIT